MSDENERDCIHRLMEYDDRRGAKLIIDIVILTPTLTINTIIIIIIDDRAMISIFIVLMVMVDLQQ